MRPAFRSGNPQGPDSPQSLTRAAHCSHDGSMRFGWPGSVELGFATGNASSSPHRRNNGNAIGAANRNGRCCIPGTRASRPVGVDGTYQRPRGGLSSGPAVFGPGDEFGAALLNEARHMTRRPLGSKRQ